MPAPKRSVKIEYGLWERFAAIARARSVTTTTLIVNAVVHYIDCPHRRDRAAA